MDHLSDKAVFSRVCIVTFGLICLDQPEKRVMIDSKIHSPIANSLKTL